MAAETDLAVMLASITVSRRSGTWTFFTVRDPDEAARLMLAGSGVDALIREAEGITAVATVEAAAALGATIEFEAAWLTLDVHSALEAVGLTAAVSRVLGDQGIPCNVIAAHHHDHLLVPVERSDDAVAAIESLRDGGA
jgi:hypothetical protein